MPVMIVGADTPLGSRIAERFLTEDREVRVFVTDTEAAEQFRSRGAKVAVGDVSDDTHISSACLNCFSVVLVDEAAIDDRHRSFASDASGVRLAWARAVRAAGVPRAIWVTDEEAPDSGDREVITLAPGPDVAEEAFERDAAKPA